ncbi:molybdopterin oxidoreductase [Methylocella silvestris BL2]|uniref:Molybdopterin oxidoreductase n=1 Tax=Methylocella silvestris (strain DSM 15510 / CIP 108128 / LMG 27833 / NCIMB 13906 / BL2) TaxID=395965 RepID=B8EJG2_METSB|nr:molybdopterin-dependent oxidoreductase [Methylocella silvestris]ACK52654.1 molybdopterin oxidoreductase [Methylocella silvestris BL2]
MHDATPKATTVLTHCPYCAMQCGMALVNDGERWSVASRDFPTNRGGLCRKGWTAAALLDAPDRLRTPLMRDHKGGKLRPASWDEALDHVVTRLEEISERSGPDAIGIFGGGGLTNEKAYMLGKFARIGLGTANIDYNGRFCMASAAAAGVKAFGLDRGMPFPMEDISRTQAILTIGGNPAETLPVMMQYFDAQREAGGTLIVVDPRRSETAKRASLHLQLTPGTDAALANGLLHVAIQHGLIDRDFIETRTSGFEAARRTASRYWPDRVERITGVPARQIEQAAHMIGEAETAMLLTGRGPEQQSQGVNNVLSFVNFMLALGKAGKPHCGYAALTGQGNGQGGREHGQKADQLPGYRRIDNPQHRDEVAAVWGVDPADLPKAGLSAVELLNALGQPGGVEALLVMGSNIVVAAPDSSRLLDRLGKLDLLVVADMFLSETAALADVVLPVAQWAEEEGTMTNLEGRILLRRPVRPPPDGVRTDNEVLKGLADRLGKGRYFTSDARETFEELGRASSGGGADYAGVTYERIDAEDGVFWPCPSPGHPGTPRLFLDRFATEDGKARFHAVEHRLSAESPDAGFPYLLTTGRVLQHYNSGAQTRRVDELRAASPEPFVEIHSETARTLGVGDGDLVALTTRRGRIVFKARLTPDIRFDTLFVPFHWGAGSVNALTNAVFDPVSKIPEFKICAVRIEKVGADAARRLNPISNN